MGLEERLFARVHRALRNATARPRRAPSPHAATFAPLAPRLRLLACALAETDVDVAAAEDDVAPRERRITVPAAIEVAATLAENVRLYQLRVAHAATALRLGLRLPAGTDAPTADLHALLAVPAIRAAAARTLPGLPALAAAAAPAILASRPVPGRLAPADAALETLVQLHLGRAPRELAAHVPEETLAWAARAAAAAPATLDALAAAARALAALGLGGGRLAPVVAWGGLPRRADEATATAAAARRPGDLPSASGTERERPRPPAATRAIELGDDAVAENPAVHSFEKVHTAEEYRGGRRRVDAEDELADHAEALDELDLREVVRGGERTRSLYRSDLAFESGAGDLEGAPPAVDAIAYDEWDARHRRYRPGWCSLRATRLEERRTAADAAGWRRAAATRHRVQVRALCAAFARIEASRRWRGRQPDGPDIDVDALVQRHADLASGHAPPDRLYCARRRHDHDIAILILLDASLSTDAWVAGRRVLDVARDAVLVVGEALATTSVAVAVAVFVSHTRHDCRFATVKGFGEPWAEGVRRLASVEPAGYTRIGPALRHATRVLEETPARRRLVLLVSDGKPTDYDRYEGRYGVADVRQAVREAERRAVRVFALAIDATARAHLPALFGKGNYGILARPEALTGALAQAVAEAVR
ncbi:MAG: VWA domain-containing protein [Deltaproteobacteria bacterium]|nr:VWA domain-containing protein [Deltaproteobacteria bacterium]